MTNPPFKVEARVVGHKKIDPKSSRMVEREALRGVDFSGAKYRMFTAVGSRFEACRFEKMRLGNFAYGAGTEPTEYIDCSFDGLRADYMGGGCARFERCTFYNVDLRDWLGWATELIDCIFSGRLRGGIFSGTVREDKRGFVGRSRNEFRGNDFSEMKLENVDFRDGIDLTQQKLPSGPEYLYLPDAEEAVRRARADVITWRNLERRREAMILINNLEEDVRNGQEQLLLRLDDYEKATRDVDEAVFALLRG